MSKFYMKKFFSVLIILILGSVFSLFADTKNIVYAQAFDFNQIDRLNISLTWENLIISQIYGEEISVEIGCNNIKKIPQVLCQDGNFIIKSRETKSRTGLRCTVYLYLPQDLNALSITINNVSGNIQADTLRAQNSVAIGNISGRTDIGSCNTEFYNLTTVSGNATLQKISAEYFDISSTSGNLFAELEHAPLASSGITNISGKSQLYIPKGAALSLSTFSISGSITNNTTPQTNSAAPQITISSVSGKIEVKEY